MAGLIGVRVDGFLSCDEVAAGGLAFSFRRPFVRVDVAEALGDREFLDFGGPLVRDGGLIVATGHTAVRFLVTRTGSLDTLGGAPHVRLGDGVPVGEFPLPAQ